MAIWYSRYPGDYAKDTADLSTLEHGIFTLLLDYYYSTGPMNPDWYRLYRICKVGTGLKERASVRHVVERFFYQNGDGQLHNKRADIELVRIEARKKRAAGLNSMRWKNTEGE